MCHDTNMYSVISLSIFLAVIIFLRHLFHPRGLYKKIYCVLVVKINFIILLYFLFFYPTSISKEKIDSRINEKFFSEREVNGLYR